MSDLRLGRWEEALASVEVDAVICDPPYSARTHEGHFSGCSDESTSAEWLARRGYDDKRSLRRSIAYAAWTADDVAAFVSSWSPRCRGWMAFITDHVLAREFEARLLDAGRYVFAPVPFVEPGKCPRMTGDGPASWSCWIVVARPKSHPWSKWGSLPGSYVFPKGTVEQTKAIVGGKPLALMRALVRDYTRRGDLVCDPCAGRRYDADCCRRRRAQGDWRRGGPRYVCHRAEAHRGGYHRDL
jgi:hypothetical protein